MTATENEFYTILCDYSNDLAALKKRNGDLPAQAAVKRLNAIMKIKQAGEIESILKVKTSHPEAYATAIAIHADRRLAELKKE